MNKLNAIVLGSLLSVSALSAVNAAETTASATWQATATKDSESDLVVTPTRALNFVYSANTKSFNTDTGLFDVAIRGDHSTATSFKLEAILDDSNNTLFSVGGEATKLKVGARWGGNDLGSIGGTVGAKSTAWTTLVAAELLASTKGLGFMIQQARGIFRLDIIIVGMIVIAITGAVLSSIIQFIGRKLIKGGRRG